MGYKDRIRELRAVGTTSSFSLLPWDIAGARSRQLSAGLVCPRATRSRPLVRVNCLKDALAPPAAARSPPVARRSIFEVAPKRVSARAGLLLAKHPSPLLGLRKTFFGPPRAADFIHRGGQARQDPVKKCRRSCLRRLAATPFAAGSPRPASTGSEALVWLAKGQLRQGLGGIFSAKSVSRRLAPRLGPRHGKAQAEVAAERALSMSRTQQAGLASIRPAQTWT